MHAKCPEFKSHRWTRRSQGETHYFFLQNLTRPQATERASMHFFFIFFLNNLDSTHTQLKYMSNLIAIFIFNWCPNNTTNAVFTYWCSWTSLLEKWRGRLMFLSLCSLWQSCPSWNYFESSNSRVTGVVPVYLQSAIHF